MEKWTEKEVREVLSKIIANSEVDYLFYFVEYLKLKNSNNYKAALNYATSKVLIDKNGL